MSVRSLVGMWGEDVAGRGFVQVPNYLLQANLFLDDGHKLSPAEMMVVLTLVSTWWEVDVMPFPSMRTISNRTGISERQVQRAVNSLEKKGFVKRRKKSVKGVIKKHEYDMTALVEMLKLIAKEYPNLYPRKIK